MAKMWAEYEAGNMVAGLALLNAFTERRWFHVLWEQWLCFPYRRIRYVCPDGSAATDGPPHGNVIVYYGPHEVKFADEFAPIGRIVRPSNKVIGSIAELIV